MRPSRIAALLVVMLAAAALAGCTGGEEPEPQEQTTQPPEEELPGQGGLVPSDDAANASQPDDQSEFAKSLDDKFHTHNYWGNALEKTLMDADVQSGPAGPTGVTDLTGYAFSVSLNSAVGTVTFGLPEGFIVPPETERLEVDISWNPDPRITGLQFAYTTALSPEDTYTLDPMPEGGQLYVIPTTVEQNDMPHTTVTKWRFTLIPYNERVPSMPGVFNGTVHVVIKAFRPDVLFVAPPHPDYWGTNTTLPVANISGNLKGERVLLPLGIPGSEGYEFVELPEGSIVYPHTGLLTVQVGWTNNGGLLTPFGGSVELYYKPPNTFQFLPATPSTSEDESATFTIPVDTAMWDSPYATISEWVFLLAMDTDAPTDQGTFGDIGSFDGSWTMGLTAEREVIV